MSTSVILQGNCGDVFVFQVGAAFSTAASSKVILQGGVTGSSIYWQINNAFGTGASSTFYGVVIAGGAFTLGASAVFTGQGFSQVSATLGANAVAGPAAACQNANTGKCFSSCGNVCPANAVFSK